MPDRIVKAFIIRSKKVNALSWQAECLYRRLINVVDDFGLYYADPMVLRADLFPMKLDKVKNADITKWLGEVRAIGLIAIYEVKSEWYLKLFNTGKPRASTSKYPMPPANICEQMIADANKCPVVVNVVEVVDVVDYSTPSELMAYDEIIQKWFKYRKDIRKPFKNADSLAMHFKSMVKLGSKLPATIEHTMANGWTGMVTPTGGKQSTRHTSNTLDADERATYENH